MPRSDKYKAPDLAAVVFDVGKVLIDWNPKHLYRQLIEGETAIDKFLTEVCTYEWNLEQDKGRLWAEAVAQKIREFPDQEKLIRAYDERWPEMVSGAIQGSVDILNDLKAKNISVYAITNFSREKWDIAIDIYPFLKSFDGVTVSADVHMLKPDRAIYEHFLKTFNLDASTLLFIDDRLENVEAAIACGFNALQFSTPEEFRRSLEGFGLL